MTNFEKITIDMDIDDLADFLNSTDCMEDTPWNKWFNTKYCNLKKCPSIPCKYDNDKTCECAYCELHKKENNEGECIFFPDKNILGGGIDIIKLWLKSEEEE